MKKTVLLLIALVSFALSASGCKSACESLKQDLLPNLQALSTDISSGSNVVDFARCQKWSALTARFKEYSAYAKQYGWDHHSTAGSYLIDGYPEPGQCLQKKTVEYECYFHPAAWFRSYWACDKADTYCTRWLTEAQKSSFALYDSSEREMDEIYDRTHTLCKPGEDDQIPSRLSELKTFLDAVRAKALVVEKEVCASK